MLIYEITTMILIITQFHLFFSTIAWPGIVECLRTRTTFPSLTDCCHLCWNIRRELQKIWNWGWKVGEEDEVRDGYNHLIIFFSVLYSLSTKGCFCRLLWLLLNKMMCFGFLAMELPLRRSAPVSCIWTMLARFGYIWRNYMIKNGSSGVRSYVVALSIIVGLRDEKCTTSQSIFLLSF